MPTRREFLAQGAGAAAPRCSRRWWIEAAAAAPPPPAGGFDAGSLQHVLSTATHPSPRLLIKASFARPLEEAPRLRVAGATVAGRRSDRAGRFWRWDVDGLMSNPLLQSSGSAMHAAAAWPSRGSCATFPAPQTRGPAPPAPVDLHLRRRPRRRSASTGSSSSIRRACAIACCDAGCVRSRCCDRQRRPRLLGPRGGRQLGSSWGCSEIARQRIGVFDPAARPSAAQRAGPARAAGPQIVAALRHRLPLGSDVLPDRRSRLLRERRGHEQPITFPPPWWKLAARPARRSALYYPEFLPVPGPARRGPPLGRATGGIRVLRRPALRAAARVPHVRRAPHDDAAGPRRCSWHPRRSSAGSAPGSPERR